MATSHYQGPSLPFDPDENGKFPDEFPNISSSPNSPSQTPSKKPNSLFEGLTKGVSHIAKKVTDIIGDDPYNIHSLPPLPKAQKDRLPYKIRQAWIALNNAIDKAVNELGRREALRLNEEQLLHPPLETTPQVSLKRITNEERLLPPASVVGSTAVVENILNNYLNPEDITTMDEATYQEVWATLSPKLHPSNLSNFNEVFAPALAKLTMLALCNPEIDITHLNHIGQAVQQCLHSPTLPPAQATILHRLHAHLSILISTLYPYHHLIQEAKAAEFPELEEKFLAEQHAWLQVAAREFQYLWAQADHSEDTHVKPDTIEYKDLLTLTELYIYHQEYHRALPILHYLKEQAHQAKDTEHYAHLTITLLDAYSHIPPKERTQQQATLIQNITKEVRAYLEKIQVPTRELTQDTLRLQAHLGRYYAQQHQYAEAIALLEPIHQLQSTNPSLDSANTTIQLARCYIKTQDIERAQMILDELEVFFSAETIDFLENSPKKAQLRTTLNNYELTRSTLEDAIEKWQLQNIKRLADLYKQHGGTIAEEELLLLNPHMPVQQPLSNAQEQSTLDHDHMQLLTTLETIAHSDPQLADTLTHTKQYCQILLNSLTERMDKLTSEQQEQLQQTAHYIRTHQYNPQITYKSLLEHQRVEQFLTELHHTTRTPLPELKTQKGLNMGHTLLETHIQFDSTKQLPPARKAIKSFVENHSQAFPSLHALYRKQAHYVHEMEHILNTYLPLYSKEYEKIEQSQEVSQAYKLLGELYLQQGDLQKAQQIQQLLRQYLSNPRPVAQESQ